jgi:Acetyltransferase (GNAT) domain/Acetyltransferase (GNAT) family
MTDASELRIRAMRPDEITIALDWAAAEGWNPGLADASCFATVDRDGFLIGELDGSAAATISCLNYDEEFAFLGFYIVRGDLRGRGYGLRIWNAAVAHAGARTIGLDGVVAQQDNYRKSGFRLAYPNIRYSGGIGPLSVPPAATVPLAEVPFAAVEADDARVFPAPRAAFLRAWIGTRGHIGRALVRDGNLAAWGVIRPCRRGHKIGPLVADDRAAAEAVLAALIAAASAGEVFLDVPSVNRNALALARLRPCAGVRDRADVHRCDPAAAARTRVRRYHIRAGLRRGSETFAWSCRKVELNAAGAHLIQGSRRSSAHAAQPASLLFGSALSVGLLRRLFWRCRRLARF